MPQASKSTPCAAQRHSSAPPSDHQRPRYLSGSHTESLRGSDSATRARAPESKRNRSREFDSSNFRAARELLQARLEAGLSQEALAVLSGEDPKTIGERERGARPLGPLRQLLICERVKKERAGK